MPQNDPQNYPYITFLWVIVLSVWGGLVHNIRKIKNGELKRFSLAELIGDITVSGFVGLITYHLCQYASLNDALSAALIGISAHMGARALLPIEKALGSWFEKLKV